MTVQDIKILLKIDCPFWSCVKYYDGSVSGTYPKWGAVNGYNAMLNVLRVNVQHNRNGVEIEIYTDN